MAEVLGERLDALPRVQEHGGREDLGADDDSEVRSLQRRGNRLVDLTNRPTAETPAFGTYPYLRDVALLTRRLLWVYAERNGLDASRSLRGSDALRKGTLPSFC